MKIWKISNSFCNLTNPIDEFTLTFEFFYSQRHCSLSIPALSDNPQPTTFTASSRIKAYNELKHTVVHASIIE